MKWADGPTFIYCHACDAVFAHSGPIDEDDDTGDIDIICPVCLQSTSLEKTLERLEKQQQTAIGMTLADFGVDV